MPNFELAYPDESSPSITYAPSRQPIVGSADGPSPGVATEMLADGSVRGKRIHSAVPSFRRIFSRLTAADRANFEAFFEAVSGIRSFRFRDCSQSDWVWVKFAGASLNPQKWEISAVGYYRTTEELVGVPVPSADALGAIRTGSLTISNLDLYADEAFSAAFSDNTWTMNQPSVYRTSGAPAPNYWLEYYNGGGSKSATGFRLRVSAPPGTGEAYTFEYLAVGS